MPDTPNPSPNPSPAGGAKPAVMRHATNIAQRVMGWMLLAPGEALAWAKGLNRSQLAWGSLGLAGVLFLSLNLASQLAFRNLKADLTADHLYTISQGSRSVMADIREPVSVRVYYSHRLGEVAPTYARLFDRVKGLLEQYRDMSRGQLQLSFLDPEPFSEAEERAAAAGLKGQRLNQDGETAYFGLVASNTTDNDATIPFFAADRERFIEYDLTKLIWGLAHPKKRIVGLISGAPIDGGANPMNPRAQPAPPWMVMEQIREFFEVRAIEAGTKEIPKDIDVLMVVQPTALTPEAAYAIDQYALGGGRILAFVDPVAEMSPAGGGMMGMSMGSPPVSADMLKLVEAWGLKLDTEKIAGDPSMARRVQFGGGPGGQPMVTDYLAWLQIEKGQLNEKDPLAASIKRLNFATAGALMKVEGATTIIQPLIETTGDGGLLDASLVRFRPDPLGLLKAFKSGGKPLMLAARIGGEAKTAFPAGRPKPEEKPEAKPETDKAAAKDDMAAPVAPAAPAKAAEAKPDAVKPDAAKSEPAATAAQTPPAAPVAAGEVKPTDGAPAGPAAKAPETAAPDAKVVEAAPAAPAAAPAAAKPAEAKPADTKAADAKAADAKAAAAKTDAKPAEPAAPAKPDATHLAAGRVNVVVVADSDMLADQFWVDVRDFLGQQVAIPQADNAGFVVNALENLAGGTALADLRGRGVVERPFDRVNDIRRQAETKFRQKEEVLNAKLKDLQAKLAKVETRGEDGGEQTVILSDAEKQAIEKFKGERRGVQRELRDVNAALRHDIVNLDGWLKFWNIAAVPLLIGLGGLGFGILNRRRNRSST